MEVDIHAPLNSLQWVDREKLHANGYNPNKVSEDNMKLLVQSILTNGWTLPIVVRPDYTIIDGFHRWTVAGREPLKSKLNGKVPMVNGGTNATDAAGARTNLDVPSNADLIAATIYADLQRSVDNAVQRDLEERLITAEAQIAALGT